MPETLLRSKRRKSKSVIMSQSHTTTETKQRAKKLCMHPTTTFLSQLQQFVNSFMYGLKFSLRVFGKIAAVPVASDFIFHYQHCYLREEFGEMQEGPSTVAMVS